MKIPRANDDVFPPREKKRKSDQYRVLHVFPPSTVVLALTRVALSSMRFIFYGFYMLTHILIEHILVMSNPHL